MMKEGRLVSNFFTREGLIYQEGGNIDESNASDGIQKSPKRDDDMLKIHLLVPKKTTLRHRIRCEDNYFIDFVRWLLEIDPMKRPTPKEAMSHPFLAECAY